MTTFSRFLFLLVCSLMLTTVSAQEYLQTHRFFPQLDVMSPIGAQGDAMGGAVDIDGDRAVVGVQGSDEQGNSSGAVVIYERVLGTWMEVDRLSPSGLDTDYFFGSSVALSGDRLVVGARGFDGEEESSGGAFVYEYVSGSWAVVQTIAPSDGEDYEYFGGSVDIDGDIMVISAYNDSEGVSLFGGGSVYIYEHNGAEFVLSAKRLAYDAAWYDYFGWDVAVSDSTVVVGSYSNDAGASNSGAVYVLERDAGDWTFSQKLLASDAGSNDQLGYAVDIDGQTIVAGARFDDDMGNNSGAVYIFEETAGTWGESIKVSLPTTASAASFGSSVAIDGDLIFGGASSRAVGGDRIGTVLGIDKVAGVWTPRSELSAADSEIGDSFGFSLAVDNGELAIGAIGVSESAVNSGSVYFYNASGSPETFVVKASSSDMIDDPSSDFLGCATAMFGNTAAVGAYGDDDFGTFSGSVFVYERVRNKWAQTHKLNASDAVGQDNFGFAVDMSRGTIIVGAYGDDDNGSASGSAYIFERDGTEWVEVAKLTAPDGQPSDNFGFSVAISEEYAIVGAYLEDDQGNNAGAAYVYQEVDGEWSLIAKLTANDGAANANFGYSVDISDSRCVVGARFDSQASTFAGAAYVYDLMPSPTFAAKLMASDAHNFQNYGTAVGIDGTDVLVGAPNDNQQASGGGALYVHRLSGGLWQQTQKVAPSGQQNGENFAFKLDIEAGEAIIGEYKANFGTTQVGSAHRMVRTAGVWALEDEFFANEIEMNAYYGFGVALSSGSYVVGAQYDDAGGNDAGAVYFIQNCLDYDQNGICDFQESDISNDYCEEATVIIPVEHGALSGPESTLFGATGVLAGCTGDADDDVWFAFEAMSANDFILAWDDDSANDMVIELFSDCEGTSLSCHDEYGVGAIERAVPGGLLVGQTYYYRIYDKVTGAQASQAARTQVYTFADMSLRAIFCGADELDISDYVQAERDDFNEVYQLPAVPVVGYGFLIENEATGFSYEVTQATVDGFQLNLTQVAGLTYGLTYQVSVRHQVPVSANGLFPLTLWSEYGTPCDISLTQEVPVASVRPEFCSGSAEYFLNENVLCDQIDNAEAYRFTFDNGSDTYVALSDNYSLFLSQVNGLQYGQTYAVTVEALVSSAWSTPGPPCFMSLASRPQNTNLITDDCGASVAFNASQHVLCQIVPGATAYQWSFIRQDDQTNTTFVTNNYSLLLGNSSSPGLFSGDYSVSVRGFAGGAWGDYALACPLTITGADMMGLQGQGPTVMTKSLDESSLDFSLYPNPVIGSQFRLQAQLSDSGERPVMITVRDPLGRLVMSQQLVTSDGGLNHIVNVQESWTAGVYLVEVIDRESVLKERLVISD